MTISTLIRVGVLAGLLALGLAAPAHAAFGFQDVTGLVAKDGAGTSATQAGSHPFASSVTVKMNLDSGFPDGNPRDIHADLPAGLVGDPTAIAQCSREAFGRINAATFTPDRPASTQVGTGHFVLSSGVNATLPIYNVEPVHGVPAQFAAQILTTPVFATARVRPTDHGLTLSFEGISQSLGLIESELTFWGVPADPRHDFMRNNFCMPDRSGFCMGTGEKANIAVEPFLTLPSRCTTTPLTTTLRTRSWQNPGTMLSRSFDTDTNGTPMAVQAASGCGSTRHCPPSSTRRRPTRRPA